jgi:hypothetical protein
MTLRGRLRHLLFCNSSNAARVWPKVIIFTHIRFAIRPAWLAGTRCNAAGHDLSAHFWNGSDQPEAYYLEREMGVHLFQGVILIEAAPTHDQPTLFL